MRNTIIMVVIFLILFVIVYVFEVRKPPQAGKPSKDALVTLELKSDNIDRFEVILIDKNKFFACSRRREYWQMTKPLEKKVNKLDMFSTLWKLEMLKEEKLLTKKPESLSPYGLDKPKAELTIWIGRNGDAVTVLFGNRNPEGSSLYAKRRDSENLYLVSVSYLEDLEKKLDELVTKKKT